MACELVGLSTAQKEVEYSCAVRVLVIRFDRGIKSPYSPISQTSLFQN